MSKNVAKLKEVQPQPMLPAELLSKALEGNASVDVLERLVAMQYHHEERLAKGAFYEALSAFQSKAPVVYKQQNGHNQIKYASLDDITATIRECLEEHGLTYRWEQEQTESLISVTCVITHKLGHSERTRLSAPADQSGSKNAVQGIGSTITYLRRYSLTGALGLTIADQDLDGRQMVQNGSFLNSDQIAQIEALITEVGADREGFLRWCKVADVSEIPANKFNNAVSALNAKRAKQ